MCALYTTEGIGLYMGRLWKEVTSSSLYTNDEFCCFENHDICKVMYFRNYQLLNSLLIVYLVDTRNLKVKKGKWKIWALLNQRERERESVGLL